MTGLTKVVDLIHGSSSSGKTVLIVGSNNISQNDMSQLDGRILPESKHDIYLWVNDKVLDNL